VIRGGFFLRVFAFLRETLLQWQARSLSRWGSLRVT
jgi:hypothetical protein